jgi:hypothetical protein
VELPLMFPQFEGLPHLRLEKVDNFSIFLNIAFIKKVVSLEQGPLSLVSTTEELLDRKVAAPV